MKTSDQINEMYEKLSSPKKVNVLMSALNYMQQYNGRSITNCIALAMGYETDGLGNYEKTIE